MTYRQRLARKKAGVSGSQVSVPRTPLGGGNYGTGTGGGDIYDGKGGGGRKGGGQRGNGGGRKEKRFNPGKVLSELDTNGVLTGQELRAGARALTALELRPALHGYKQLANQLTQQRDATDQGIATLAKGLQGGVSEVYSGIARGAAQDLATQQALAAQLNNQAGTIAQDTSSALQGMQDGQLGDFEKALELRSAPGGGAAQEELANVVAEQRANQAQQSAQARQSASAQGASYAQLQGLMGAATQMQGGAAVAGIGRAAQNRKASSDEKYGQAIQEALGKWGDTKATKGSTFAKNLLELREKEQKFKLGEQAVAGEKGQLQLGREELGEERQQHKEENRLNWAEHDLKQWEAEHPHASSDEKREHRKQVKGEVGEVQAMIPSLVSAYGAPWAAESNGKSVPLDKAVNAFILALNEKVSADPKLVRHVVKTWVERHYKKAAKDPNGPSLGR